MSPSVTPSSLEKTSSSEGSGIFHLVRGKEATSSSDRTGNMRMSADAAPSTWGHVFSVFSLRNNLFETHIDHLHQYTQFDGVRERLCTCVGRKLHTYVPCVWSKSLQGTRPERSNTERLMLYTATNTKRSLLWPTCTLQSAQANGRPSISKAVPCNASLLGQQHKTYPDTPVPAVTSVT